MSDISVEKRLSPLIILSLVALLVLVLGLWTFDRMERGPSVAVQAQTNGMDQQVYKWKMVPLGPKIFRAWVPQQRILRSLSVK